MFPTPTCSSCTVCICEILLDIRLCASDVDPRRFKLFWHQTPGAKAARSLESTKLNELQIQYSQHYWQTFSKAF